MHMQNLVKFHQFVPKLLIQNEILTITKGQNCIVNLQKFMHNNPSLDLVKVNTYGKFDKMHSISEDIEQKQNSDNNQEP